MTQQLSILPATASVLTMVVSFDFDLFDPHNSIKDTSFRTFGQSEAWPGCASTTSNNGEKKSKRRTTNSFPRYTNACCYTMRRVNEGGGGGMGTSNNRST
uniref:Putative secreted protein n=1 Tax=Anopheles marajoara TaxID=58244 RepID=A0A2M4C8V1_9DIPT